MARVRWSMFLSHHAPVDYDRTWKLGAVHICIRCLGVAVGAIVALASWRAWAALPAIVFILLAVPGVLDFTVHELALSASSTARRFLTGLLFGLFAAALIHAVTAVEAAKAVVYLTWFILLQCASAFALKRSGRLGQLITRYENGVYLKSSAGKAAAP